MSHLNLAASSHMFESTFQSEGLECKPSTSRYHEQIQGSRVWIHVSVL